MIGRCRISIVGVFGVLQPNSGRSLCRSKRFSGLAQCKAGPRCQAAGIAWFYRALMHGTDDGVTRLRGIMEWERTALFYDGTVATKCREMTIYDASGRFRTLIRPKSGTFYDENSAINSWIRQTNDLSRQNSNRAK